MGLGAFDDGEHGSEYDDVGVEISGTFRIQDDFFMERQHLA